MRVVLDAGALIAVDRADARVMAILKLSERRDRPVVTVAPVVGQVWRDGARQARLARMLQGVEVLDVTEVEARRAGELLGATGHTDVVDALVAQATRTGDHVVTSDPDDITTLIVARAVTARLIAV